MYNSVKLSTDVYFSFVMYAFTAEHVLYWYMCQQKDNYIIVVPSGRGVGEMSECAVIGVTENSN